MQFGFYNWYFRSDNEDRSAARALLWWELRRIPFNLLVAAAGLPSLFLVLVFADASVVGRTGEDIVEPVLIILAPFVLNFLYTFGWFAELIVLRNPESHERISPAVLLKFGTGISLAIVSAPAVIWGAIFVLIKLGLMEAIK